MKLPLYLYSMHQVCPKSVTCCEVSECFPSTPRCGGCPSGCAATVNKKSLIRNISGSPWSVLPKVITTNNYMKSLWLFPHFHYCTHCKCLSSTTLSLVRAADFGTAHGTKATFGKYLGGRASAVPSPRKCAPDSLTLTPKWRDTGGKVLEVVRPLMMQRPNHHS